MFKDKLYSYANSIKETAIKVKTTATGAGKDIRAWYEFRFKSNQAFYDALLHEQSYLQERMNLAEDQSDSEEYTRLSLKKDTLEERMKRILATLTAKENAHSHITAQKQVADIEKALADAKAVVHAYTVAQIENKTFNIQADIDCMKLKEAETQVTINTELADVATKNAQALRVQTEADIENQTTVELRNNANNIASIKAHNIAEVEAAKTRGQENPLYVEVRKNLVKMGIPDEHIPNLMKIIYDLDGDFSPIPYKVNKVYTEANKYRKGSTIVGTAQEEEIEPTDQ